MKSFYALPEELALKKFTYPEKWWYDAIVFDHHVSIFKYIRSLILFLIFFGGGLQVLILPGYFRHVKTQDNLFTKLFTFNNVYSDILFALRWSSVIVVGGLCILMFIAFLRNRKEVYKFHAYVGRYMVVLLVYFLVMALLFTLAFSPHPFPSFEYFYGVLLVGIFIQVIRSIRRYEKKLYDAGELGDPMRWMSIFPMMLILYPVYVFFRNIFRWLLKSAGISVEGVLGPIYLVLALLYPYFLLLKPDVIVHKVLYIYLREYYIVKYPEGFRKQAGLSREEFYLGISKEPETIERGKREEAEKKRKKQRWWRRFQIVQGTGIVLFFILGVVVNPSLLREIFNFRIFASLLSVYGILVLVEYVLWRTVDEMISLYKYLKERDGNDEE